MDPVSPTPVAQERPLFRLKPQITSLVRERTRARMAAPRATGPLSSYKRVYASGHVGTFQNCGFQSRGARTRARGPSARSSITDGSCSARTRAYTRISRPVQPPPVRARVRAGQRQACVRPPRGTLWACAEPGSTAPTTYGTEATCSRAPTAPSSWTAGRHGGASRRTATWVR